MRYLLMDDLPTYCNAARRIELVSESKHRHGHNSVTEIHMALSPLKCVNICHLPDRINFLLKNGKLVSFNCAKYIEVLDIKNDAYSSINIVCGSRYSDEFDLVYKIFIENPNKSVRLY